MKTLNHKLTTFSFALLFLFAFSISTAFAQEVRSVSNFEEISSGGSFDIKIVKSSKNEVKIEGADADLLEKLETQVDGNRLRIGIKKGNSWSSRGYSKVTITVYHTEKLEKLSLAGSGSMEWDGELYSSTLEISVAGSGKVCGRVAVSDLEASIAGSGKICLKGAATKQEVRIAGSGDYEAEDLKTQDTEIKISGSGDANVYVTKNLEAKISGSGDIRYTTGGNELERQIVKVSGSGKVRKG
ncbi:head GIN domain-containing protein [Bernardetia sp. Wsw4-3y2]|uniref:head GIN domain-containing protein n=1 Tax=Bernardetia sp. Wsw4-3y2 TaxID=3127471 RepID=UPI0030D32D5E